jgi:hypothetical protein
LKRGSMRSWLSASLMMLMTSQAGAGQAKPAHSGNHFARDNEWRLAGLWPGHTSLSGAEIILGKASLDEPGGKSLTWHTCRGDFVIADADGRGIIQSVRVSKDLSGQRKNDCYKAVRNISKWATGKGLRLGNSVSRVLQLYGAPESRSPSTKDGQQLELLYYPFDWAGPDVPQVMQVLCTAGNDGQSGRVVEIMLSASSL